MGDRIVDHVVGRLDGRDFHGNATIDLHTQPGTLGHGVRDRFEK